MVVKLRVWLTVCAFSSVALVSGNAALAAKDSGGSKPAKSAQGKQVESNPRGQVLALSCTSCHGTDGKSVGIIPSFNTRSSAYIEAALKGFKSGERYSTVMGRHAKGYSDDELRLIANYFGKTSNNK
ncbi:MAG: sulfide dehydrogenase [Chlorobium sp.]|nr:MAG: sulfide dehydrogenase [Chlorobium sp.]